MTTNPVSSSPMPLNALTSKDKPTTTDPNSSLGQDAFLKLLVAQLKYQDPMNPADGADFMAQTAQFTMVEKLGAMQKQGEATIASQKQLQAIQLVGKQVTYTDTTGMAREGVVQSARFTPDGQTLTINGTTVNLSSVTGVTRAPVESSTTGSSTTTNSALTETLTAAIREALAAAKSDTSTTVLAPTTSTGSDTAIVPDASTGSTSTDGALATETSSSDAPSESGALEASDPASGEG